MPFLKCSDVDNGNNAIVISDGEINIYKDINGTPTLFTPLSMITNNAVTVSSSATSTTSLGTYKYSPEVFVFPQKMQTYNANYINAIQEISISQPSISLGTDGKATISNLSASLYTKAGWYDVFVTQEFGALSDWGGTTTYNAGPFYVPNITYANYTYSVQTSVGYTVTCYVGISSTTSSSISWGAVASSSGSAQANNYITPAVSASGNYIWLQAISNTNHYDYAFVAMGGRVYSNGGVAINSDSAILNLVEVGR